MSRSLKIIPFIRKSPLIKAPILPSCSGIVIRKKHSCPAVNKLATMDDMLVPCGSWQENYDNNQRRYNIHLLFGTGFFILTVAFGKYAGVFDFNLTPDRPSPKIP